MFDFTSTYTSYSNDALVQIVANPEGYQPEAVAAAKALLHERGITPEQLQDLIDPPQATIPDAPAIQYEDGQTNIFEEIQQRPVSEQTQRRRTIIAGAWSIVIAITAFRTLSFYYGVFSSPMYRPSFSFAFANILATFFPVWCIYQLYRRKKWGWIWTTLFMSFFAAIQIPAVFRLLTNKVSTADNILWQLIPLVWLPANIIFLSYLLNNRFREDYRIPRRIMWWPVGIGAALYFLPYLLTLL